MRRVTATANRCEGASEDEESPQRGVETLQRGSAGTQLVLGELVEWCVHRVQMGVQVRRVRVHVEQPGYNLTLGVMLLQVSSWPRSDRSAS